MLEVPSLENKQQQQQKFSFSNLISSSPFSAAQNCAEYEDNTGCSSCEAGYRKQTSDDTCYGNIFLNNLNELSQVTSCVICAYI